MILQTVVNKLEGESLTVQVGAIADNASNASNLNYVIVGLVVIIVILIVITLFGNKK